MASWRDFEAEAPDLAAAGRRALVRDGINQGLVATVRGAGLPRIHPVYVEVVNGRLYTFVLRSAKRRDLEGDGRYAFHAHQGTGRPHRVRAPRPCAVRRERRGAEAAAAAWSFEVDDGYGLFELGIESALVGFRPSPDYWPPRYASWTPALTASGRACQLRPVVGPIGTCPTVA